LADQIGVIVDDDPGGLAQKNWLISNVGTVNWPLAQQGVSAVYNDLDITYATTVAPGAVTVSPGLFTAADVIYAPAITALAASAKLAPALASGLRRMKLPAALVGSQAPIRSRSHRPRNLALCCDRCAGLVAGGLGAVFTWCGPR
jgi:hypothetical protein